MTPGLLKDQLARGKSLFVRQTFLRGYEGRLKAAFLVRGYGADERELAERHFAAIAGGRDGLANVRATDGLGNVGRPDGLAHAGGTDGLGNVGGTDGLGIAGGTDGLGIGRDPNAFLYDVQVPAHVERLEIAAGQPFGYKVFYAAKKGVEWKPPESYQEKMKAYIRRHHSGWRTKKDGDKIQIGLYEEFGELFLKFSYEEEHDTIPFDLIEKY